MHQEDVTREGWTAAEACKRLADAGADVVGLNCIRGPETMMPLLQQIRARGVDTDGGPARALPDARERTVVPVATRFTLARRLGRRPFPIALDPFTCNRFEIADFGRAALRLASVTWASAAVRARITSARSPRRSASIRRRPGTRPTCRSTRSWARTSGSSRCRRTMRKSCRRATLPGVFTRRRVPRMSFGQRLRGDVADLQAVREKANFRKLSSRDS